MGDPHFFYISDTSNSHNYLTAVKINYLTKYIDWKIFMWMSLSENFDLNFVTFQWGFLSIVWCSVWSLNNLKIHETKAVKNICIQELFTLLLTLILSEC